MATNVEPLLVPVSDAGKMLGLSRSSVYALIAAKRLPLVKIGRSSRVPVAGVKALADSLINLAA